MDLYYLISINYVVAFKQAVRNGADINETTGDYTPLMSAITEDRYRIIEFLIQMGADVNIQTEHGETALMIAAERSYTTVIKMLIQAGADVNLRDENNKTALMMVGSWGSAVQNTYDEDAKLSVSLLIQAGATLTQEDYNSLNPRLQRIIDSEQESLMAQSTAWNRVMLPQGENFSKQYKNMLRSPLSYR